MKNTKNENLKAQFISNSVLRKNSRKSDPPPTEFYLVETGNCKPETGNQNKKMGPRRFELPTFRYPMPLMPDYQFRRVKHERSNRTELRAQDKIEKFCLHWNIKIPM